MNNHIQLHLQVLKQAYEYLNGSLSLDETPCDVIEIVYDYQNGDLNYNEALKMICDIILGTSLITN